MKLCFVPRFRRLFPITFLWAGMVALAGNAACAQTDVAASLFGAFSNRVSSGGTLSPSNAAGALFEVRHIRNSLAGFEATYSYHRANQVESFTTYPQCPAGTTCGPSTTTEVISANAHEFTLDWLASFKAGHLRPFVLAGGGVLFDVPSADTVTETSCNPMTSLCSSSSASAPTAAQSEPLLVYGAGLDWRALPHIGLRMQYRGEFHKTPGLVNGVSSVDTLMHTAEPMLGLYFRL